MKKTLILILLLALSKETMAFDNSIYRWEGDCLLKVKILSNYKGADCSIAGDMYQKGFWIDDHTGKHIKIKGTREEQLSKAKALFKIACGLTKNNNVCKFIKGSQAISVKAYKYK